jgi:hypothetical protein
VIQEGQAYDRRALSTTSEQDGRHEQDEG